MAAAVVVVNMGAQWRQMLMTRNMLTACAVDSTRSPIRRKEKEKMPVWLFVWLHRSCLPDGRWDEMMRNMPHHSQQFAERQHLLIAEDNRLHYKHTHRVLLLLPISGAPLMHSDHTAGAEFIACNEPSQMCLPSRPVWTISHWHLIVNWW